MAIQGFFSEDRHSAKANGERYLRCEFHAENFLGMVRLGCMKVRLRHL